MEEIARIRKVLGVLLARIEAMAFEMQSDNAAGLERRKREYELLFGAKASMPAVLEQMVELLQKLDAWRQGGQDAEAGAAALSDKDVAIVESFVRRMRQVHG